MREKIYKNFSVVIPAFNEAKTIDKVIEQVLSMKEVAELVIVNDGSTDKTEEKALKFKTDPRLVYVKHPRNKGKGFAVKTGVNKAKNEIILLLDADLQNINPQKIRKICNPVLYDEVDVSRAGFRLARGRVTEIAVKPMMRILFPGIYFDQPISGQVCAKKSFLQTVDLETKWGVDIGILLDAIQAGQRIVEVDIGKLNHKARTDGEKAEMAEQVLETMIKKAGLIQHKYKLVTFTLDDTLVPKKSLNLIFEKLGIGKEINELKIGYETGNINFQEFLTKSAALFKGKNIKAIEEIANTLPLMKYASEVINALKRRKYHVAIVSSNFSPVVLPIANKLGADMIECVFLESVNNKLTGKITIRSQEKWLNQPVEDSFEKAFSRINQKFKVKPFAGSYGYKQ